MISWSVRFKNKTFIISLATVVLTFVYRLLSLFEIVPKISEDAIVQIVMMLLNVLAALGIVIDPTTPGIKDPNADK